MKLYQFNKQSGKKISQFNSNFIMSRIVQTENGTNIGCMHLEENGITKVEGIERMVLFLNYRRLSASFFLEGV